MDFEHLVIPYEFCDDLVDSVVELDEFLFLIVLLLEYRVWLLWCLFQVLFHIEQQFK